MPTHASEHRPAGVGETAKVVAEHASAIARLEMELALAEVKGKAIRLGLGIGLAVGGAFFALLGIGFGCAAAAAAIGIAIPTAAAIGAIAGGLLMLAGLLALLGVGALKRGSPPVPEQAITEAKLTTEALKSNGKGSNGSH